MGTLALNALFVSQAFLVSTQTTQKLVSAFERVSGATCSPALLHWLYIWHLSSTSSAISSCTDPASVIMFPSNLISYPADFPQLRGRVRLPYWSQQRYYAMPPFANASESFSSTARFWKPPVLKSAYSSLCPGQDFSCALLCLYFLAGPIPCS